MLKNKNLQKEYYSKYDFQEMFTRVDVKAENLPQSVKDDFLVEEGQEYICCYLDEALEMEEKKYIEYSDINYEWSDWDDLAYKDFIAQLVKNSNHYMVYLPHSTWRGATGCGFTDDLKDAFYRGYDCSQYVKAVTKGNKACLLRESHHDVPMGHYVVIIALTDKEYEHYNNSSFEECIKFAENYLDNLIASLSNKKEQLKAILEK